MLRLLPLAASITAAAFTFAIAAPVHAQAPSYRAVPVTAMTASQNVIVADMMWKCGPSGCTTENATARPAIVCAQAARKLGRIESFTVGTAAFDADALAKCNERAKS